MKKKPALLIVLKKKHHLLPPPNTKWVQPIRGEAGPSRYKPPVKEKLIPQLKPQAAEIAKIYYGKIGRAVKEKGISIVDLKARYGKFRYRYGARILRGSSNLALSWVIRNSGGVVRKKLASNSPDLQLLATLPRQTPISQNRH